MAVTPEKPADVDALMRALSARAEAAERAARVAQRAADEAHAKAREPPG